MNTSVAGARSTRLARIFVEVAWWFALAATVATAGLLVVAPVLMKTRSLAPRVEAAVSLERGRVLASLPLTSPDTVVAARPVLAEGEASLQLHTRDPWFLVLTVLLRMPALVALLIGLDLLRRLLNDVRAGELFTAGNARRVSWVGWLLVVVGLVKQPLAAVRAGYILHHTQVSGVALGSSRAPGQSLVIPGLFVLVLAAAWRYGVELQRDRDLTV